MKKTITAFIIAAVLAMCVAATAQVAKTHARAGANAGARAGAFDGEKAAAWGKLGLTDDQKQQIKGIIKDYFTQIKPILQSNAAPQDKKAQIEPLRTKAVDSIMAVLTPDQQAKARDMKLPEKMLRMNHHRAGIMIALKQLNLTDQQKTQIKDILQATHEKAKAIKDDTSLTQDQKKAQLKDLRESTRQQVMSMLTPEQQQKLQQMMQQRKQQAQQNGRTLQNRPAGPKARTK